MEYRTIERGEIDAFITTLSNAFGEVRVEEHDLEIERALTEPARTWAAIDDGRIVGCAGTYSLRTVVPGGVTAGTAGVTLVGVLPTHRRQGITTELLGRIFQQSVERGEPLASLFASQAAIYGRFGFGLASQLLELDVLIDRVRFAEGFEPTGRVRLLPRDEAVPLMHAVFERFAPTRPGVNPLDAATFDWYFTEKKKKPRFFAVHEDDAGTPDAFAVYRIKHDWPRSLPHLQVKLGQLIATTPAASAAMWRYLFDIDLVSHVTTESRPVDEPLLWQLEEPRATRARLYDGLYSRPLDVAAALAVRAYGADGHLVLAVNDPYLPDVGGVFALEVQDGKGTCGRVDAVPDLTCTVHAIGSTYLGAVSWSSLANAGRVEVHDPRALARADAMFASGVAPWVPFFF